MLSAILAAAFLAGAPAPELKVDVGQANWASLPQLRAVARGFPTADMVTKVHDMLGRDGCSVPGQRKVDFDFDVPYAVKVNPDGSADHVIVADMHCPPLESYVGLIVLELARRGDFRASAGSQPTWYASSLNFNLQWR